MSTTRNHYQHQHDHSKNQLRTRRVTSREQKWVSLVERRRFNYGLPNSYKGGRTPWDILHEGSPELGPQTLYLAPVLLETLLEQRLDACARHGPGQDVPADPVTGHAAY